MKLTRLNCNLYLVSDVAIHQLSHSHIASYVIITGAVEVGGGREVIK